MTRARTIAACEQDAIANLHRATAYQAGYLEGAIRTAIIQLEYETPEVVAAGLECALIAAKGMKS
jgi:hypothetical protein